MKEFTYEVVYHGADGQSAICTGSIEVEPGDFQQALIQVMRRSFLQITQGKATYGQPGKGCRGPYQITRFLLQQKADA